MSECDHGLSFDVKAVASGNFTEAEIRKRWPRLDGKCEKCGLDGIAYANAAHYFAWGRSRDR